MLCAYGRYVNDMGTIGASSAEQIISCKVLCEPVHKTICRPMLASAGDHQFTEEGNWIQDLSLTKTVDLEDVLCVCFDGKKCLKISVLSRRRTLILM
ncbi:hypothetical protein Tco_0561500 [Tanacetum coccineum]